MLIQIGLFELEVCRRALFVRLPGIGQAFIAPDVADGKWRGVYDNWEAVTMERGIK